MKKVEYPPLTKQHYTFEDAPDCLCPIPFTTLIFNPDGKVGCCRERTNHDVVGNIKESSWEEIWNGEEIRAWRREFLSGDIKRCKNLIQTRMCNLNDYNRLLLPYTTFTEYQEKPPIHISPDFNGKCNLECVMCKIWQMDNGLYDRLGFWTDAEENLFPNIKFVDPLAGEPFIQKDLYRLIRILKKKASNARWRFTTNGHWKFTDYITKHLDMIEDIHCIQTSIDGATPEMYARVRKNGKLSVVLKNLEDQKKYNEERKAKGRKTFKMMQMMTVIRENWKEIPLMCRLMESMNVNYHFIKCDGPDDMMIVTLPLKDRLTILDYLFNNLEDRDYVHVSRVLIPLIDSIPKSESTKILYQKKFFKESGYWV
jgi:cyclic pyranopterin phosphate synthase